MATYKERYTPVVMAANSEYKYDGNAIGGFLCVTGGTITVERNDVAGATTTVINAFPVTAGEYHQIPFYLGSNGATITTSGGASGTLGVA